MIDTGGGGGGREIPDQVTFDVSVADVIVVFLQGLCDVLVTLKYNKAFT